MAPQSKAGYSEARWSPLEDKGFCSHTWWAQEKGHLDTHPWALTHTHCHPYLLAQAVLTHRLPIELGTAEQVYLGLLHTALG